MSWMPSREPQCHSLSADDGLDMVIQPRARDLSGLAVARLLPAIERKMVGPFIFFDHMLAQEFAPGQGIDVRPHPHIALATVTYLFEGELVHRDSLGTEQVIRPGAINWMTAGRGIVHSERTDSQKRQGGERFHGIQVWVALPLEHEETEPFFHHHAQKELPVVEGPGYTARVLIGGAFGQTSPVRIFSPMFYVDVEAQAGSSVELPHDYEERALYLVSGSVRYGNQLFEQPQLGIFKKDHSIRLHIQSDARFILLGGAPLDGPRFIWWNFISSSKDRIEQAKLDWKEGRFPKVPTDSVEFIPLPDS
ncbi:pirin family protein [Oligoflexus tunisiensis]|uniref:pirin family protein n=1 Tax=Oligoflexus tunisiensis TaxID=708132 RepID=UPI000ADC11EC|nr:pirin family protein [Oligoflexus tunisiensis]